MSKFNFNNNYKHNIDNKNLIIRKKIQKNFAKIFHVSLLSFLFRIN